MPILAKTRRFLKELYREIVGDDILNSAVALDFYAETRSFVSKIEMNGYGPRSFQCSKPSGQNVRRCVLDFAVADFGSGSLIP